MDKTYYELTDLDGIEVLWENIQLMMIAVSRPVMLTQFSQLVLTDFEMGGRPSENRIVLDKEEDKENSHLKTPVSERPTETPSLLRIGPLGKQIENLPELVYTTPFESNILWCDCVL